MAATFSQQQSAKIGGEDAGCIQPRKASEVRRQRGCLEKRCVGRSACLHPGLPLTRVPRSHAESPFIRPHTCAVPQCTVATCLFSELPRRVLLGNPPVVRAYKRAEASRSLGSLAPFAANGTST